MDELNEKQQKIYDLVLSDIYGIKRVLTQKFEMNKSDVDEMMSDIVDDIDELVESLLDREKQQEFVMILLQLIPNENVDRMIYVPFEEKAYEVSDYITIKVKELFGLELEEEE